MDIGKEEKTYTITPTRTTQPKPARVPKRDWKPATRPAPVEDPARTPVKTPSR